jgi:uncharacterized protein (TIGR04255 family)
MPKLFPDADRAIYETNPLFEVICQLRFPTLLKLEGQLPVEYQEAVRHRFPILQRQTATIPDLPEEVSRQIFGAMSPVSYIFKTEDEMSSIRVAPDSLSLTTSRYVRWENFNTNLRLALDNFERIYSPNFYSRIGLRYRNAIIKSVVGLPGDIEWVALIRPEVAGELCLEGWRGAGEVQKSIRINIGEGHDKLLFQHGLGSSAPNNEICYILDFDYYNESRSQPNESGNTVDRLHSYSGRAFRWAISDELHERLRPRYPAELNSR